MFGKKNIALIFGEFFGVGILTLVFYSMLARTPFPFFSGIAVGITLAALTVVLGKVSGAHLNPALTISMWVMRKIDTASALVYIAAQVVGGVAAWQLINYFMGRSITSIAAPQFAWKVLVAEGIGTAVAAFGAAAAMINDLELSKRALITGGSFALGIMVASLASNGIINPAVALGIRSWDWSYAVGPIFGAVVGSNIYALLYAGANTPVRGKAKKSRR